ncbi:MAG: class I SAM-dependent methyltransferase [Actinomycetota bacterium]|nr:class I SAM-dependent methyltransferase [Actinomycetota bacterium]
MSDAPSNRWLAEAGGRAGTYDDRWEELAAQGHDVHGEADLVSWLGAATVIDAGCGTGRVALELARRGVDVVGVDLDPAMLQVARAKGPELRWIQGDLADLDLDLGRAFDVVVMAGNVMIFVAPGTEGRVVANLARHLAPGGALVAGFQLDEGRLDLATYDAHCAAAGLALEHRWATWDRQPWVEGGSYAVSVYQRTAPED